MAVPVTQVWCGACGIRFEIALAPEWVERIGRCGECGERALLVLGTAEPHPAASGHPRPLPAETDGP